MTGAAVIGMAGVATAVVVMAAGRRVQVTDDETWFLHVVQRIRAGEVLYRDVFFGAGPLAVWAASAVVRLTRPQVLVMRALGVVSFVGFLCAGTWTLRSVGSPWWSCLLLWLGAVALGGPSWGTESQYGQLTFLAAAVALACLAVPGDGGPWYVAALAGTAAGAALACKHTVGAVLMASAIAVLLGTGSAAGELGVFCAGAVVVLAATFAPVARAGALSGYARCAFANKVTYVASGGMAAWDGLRNALAPGPPAGRIAALARFVTASAFLVLPAAVLAMVADVVVLAAGGPAQRRVAAAVGMAAAATALAGAVPRADGRHVQGLFPMALLAILVSASALDTGVGWWPPPPPVAWPAGVVLMAWTALALVVALDTVHRVPVSAEAVDDDLPHLRGVPVQRWLPGAGPRQGQALREATGGSVFLLRPDAAWWYLAAGLRNPTPYDYPYASVFGPRGQAEMIAAIRRGDVPWVCLPAPMVGRLAPTELQTFVVDCMEPVAETAAGTLYRLPVGSDACAGARRS